MRLSCPKCKKSWEQALTPGVKTQTRCPHCEATFVTLMKPKAQDRVLQAPANPHASLNPQAQASLPPVKTTGPTFVQNPPRYQPSAPSTEFQKQYLALLKLALHNSLIKSTQISELLSKQNQIQTNRDLFENLVNKGFLNPAEFDALRVLLENTAIQELVLILSLQEKRGPIVLSNKSSTPAKTQAPKNNMQTLADEEDYSENQTLLDEDYKQSESQTLTDDREEDTPAPRSKRSESATLIDEDDVSFPRVATHQNTFKVTLDKIKKKSAKNLMPEVPVSLPESQMTRKIDPPTLPPPAMVDNEMVTMVESSDELEVQKPTPKELDKQETLFQQEVAEETYVEELKAPSATGKELLNLLKQRDKVRLFHDYEIEREIARSPKAILFYVTHFADPFCLKVLFYEDETLKRERFRTLQNTLSNLKKIQHANIVEVTDVGEFQGVPYLLMPRNTATSLDKQKNILPKTLFEWIQIAVQTLRSVHQKGIIHGNLKARNILISNNQRVYLTDFALFGGLLADFSSLEKLQPSAVSALPPEYLEAKGERTLAPTLDIYAIGVLLYETLAGRSPFPGDQVAKITYQKINKEPPSLTETTRLDPQYNLFIFNCMATKPENRYPDLEALYQDLEKVLKGKPIKPLNKKGLFGFRS
jgi:serine/threonine protein kinase